MNQSLKLGVNVDHVATVRQARGTEYPSPYEAAQLCMAAGATSITLHLREDRRHIQDADVYAVAADPAIPLNLEMADVLEIVEIVLKVSPEEVCLVPERREERTTEGGLDVVGAQAAVGETVRRLKGAGVLVSLFIAPDEAQIAASLAVGAGVVEFHTGTYCEAVGAEREAELHRLIRGAELAHAAGLQVNAGHGINLGNIVELMQVPHMDTLNIGHSIVSRAVMVGMSDAVKEMLSAMEGYT
jgi:pyridoxine 5-phosphate synthase